MESEEILGQQFTGSWSTCSPISEKRFPISYNQEKDRTERVCCCNDGQNVSCRRSYVTEPYAPMHETISDIFVKMSQAPGDTEGLCMPNWFIAYLGSAWEPLSETCDWWGRLQNGIPDDVDNCPESNLEQTIIIDGCDSEVENLLFEDGCTMSDLIAECADGANNHGKFVSCVSHLTNDWKSQNLISGKEKGAIQSCAAQADIP
jgi:hypothetical protein